jgi:hypothetical protein
MSTSDSKKKISTEQSDSSEHESETEERDEQPVVSKPVLFVFFTLIRAQQRRRRLLKELSARLTRDQQLRYTVREFEMQRLLMGRGGRMKLKGVEKVEDDEEVTTKMKSTPRKGGIFADVTYKPRIYKWRLEQKR